VASTAGAARVVASGSTQGKKVGAAVLGRRRRRVIPMSDIKRGEARRRNSGISSNRARSRRPVPATRGAFTGTRS
jgi:hypothetical protein